MIILETKIIFQINNESIKDTTNLPPLPSKVTFNISIEYGSMLQSYRYEYQESSDKDSMSDLSESNIKSKEREVQTLIILVTRNAKQDEDNKSMIKAALTNVIILVRKWIENKVTEGVVIDKNIIVDPNNTHVEE